MAEVTFHEGDDVEALTQSWFTLWNGLREALPFAVGERVIRPYEGGAAFFCQVPIDALYAAVDLNEAILTGLAEGHLTESPEDWRPLVERCVTEYNSERCDALRSLKAAAERRGVPFLWDDDDVSLGYGRYSKTWSRDAMPDPDELDWSGLRTIPVLLITGTNGKTTTARLLARMIQDAGYTVGNSSTDGISVNGRVIDEGDWTGPGAAREVLRHPEVECAVLETARGGLLRRGIGVESCNGALVTNVADDHLGDYGVLDLTDMARAKGVVYSVVSQNGVRVFNMDNPFSASLRGVYPGRAILTSVKGRASIEPFLNSHTEAVYLEQGALYLGRESGHEILLDVKAMPLSRSGTALHDVSNALGATALAWSLGIAPGVIQMTLRAFGRSQHDNPGRGRMVELNGVRVLLDFGHNPHGVDAVLSMAKKLTGTTGRLGVSFAQAGDRSDQDFRALAHTVARHTPDKVYLRDLPEPYHRGRTVDDMASMLANALEDAEMPSQDVERVSNEVEALRSGIAWARSGDLLVHLVHLEREPVEEWLQTRGGTSC